MSTETTPKVESKPALANFAVNTNRQPGKIDIKQLLSNMLVNGASDLHLKAPIGPVYRIHGELSKQEAFEVTMEDVEEVFCQIATEPQKSAFYSHNEVDFAFSIPRVGRFRVNVQRQ